MLAFTVRRAMVASARRPVCAAVAPALPWEAARFQGANITIDGPVDDSFEPRLEAALTELKAEGRRGIWMHVPIEHSAAAGVAARHGFSFHHAEGGESVLLRWMTDDAEPCPVPPFATHIVGVGGLVLDDQSRVLCVREAQSHRAASWKLPGGLMDLAGPCGGYFLVFKTPVPYVQRHLYRRAHGPRRGDRRRGGSRGPAAHPARATTQLVQI